MKKDVSLVYFVFMCWKIFHEWQQSAFLCCINPLHSCSDKKVMIETRSPYTINGKDQKYFNLQFSPFVPVLTSVHN